MVEDGNSSPETDFTDQPPPIPDLPAQDDSSPDPAALVEIIPPTPISLRAERGGRPGRSRQVMASLTADALWIQDTWRLRHVPLFSITAVEELRNGKELALPLGIERTAERLRLTFSGAEEGQRWHEELEGCREELSPDPPLAERPVPDGVTLLRQVPEVAHAVLGKVEFTAATSWLADRGLQLVAARQGADAVIGLVRHKCPNVGPGARHVSGTAVRIEDAADRARLRRRWFAEQVAVLVRQIFMLLVVQAALLLLAGLVCARAAGFSPPTNENPSEVLRSMGFVLVALFAWPLMLLALLRFLRWPLFLGSVGLAVLAVTTGRGLAVALGHLLAVRITGADLVYAKVWYLADPVDWTIIVLGLVLAVRTWRLAREAPHILPPAIGTPPGGWRASILALTGIYAVALVGFAGYSRYEMIAGMLLPKGGAWFPQDEAMQAFDEGLAADHLGDMAGAERGFLRCMRLLEERTDKPGALPMDHANLGIALYNLGLVCRKTGRPEEAERYYERAVAIGERRPNLARDDDHFRRCLTNARAELEALRDDRTERELREKEHQGVLKCEKAQILAEKGDAGAEALFAEAIGLWEDVLKQATALDYKKSATGRLAWVYLMLGDLRQRLGKAHEAEAALLKSIDYGGQAVKLDPDRPLNKHNLEIAHRLLDRQHEDELERESDRLIAARRYADAVALWQRRTAEQEELLRSGQDREAIERRLAYRLDRLAWLLAHCPDRRVRDTKAAVGHARRAATLQPDVAAYQFNLAMAQYRNGDWNGSLKSLDQLKGKEGGFGAREWLLTAMNRYQLKQRKGAGEAFQKADEWIEERKRQGEDDPALRFQDEMMRPFLERLRREAEDLLNGKDPANEGIG